MNEFLFTFKDKGEIRIKTKMTYRDIQLKINDIGDYLILDNCIIPKFTIEYIKHLSGDHIRR